MTYNEIVEALKHCILNCNSYCPLHEHKGCRHKLMSGAYYLINRQKAENDRLRSLIKEANEYFSKGDFANGIAIIILLVKEMESDEE